MKIKESLDQLKDTLFESIHGNFLIYNTCWEDPRVDRKLMNFQIDSEIVMITSAGDNALDYLMDNPLKIHCVDVNHRQNALLELKLAFLKDQHYESFHDFFVNGSTTDAFHIYKKHIRCYLDKKTAAFWDDKIHYFDGYTKKKRSFYYKGTSGQFALMFRHYLNARPATKNLVKDLLAATDMETQRAIYKELEPKMLNKMVNWILDRQTTMTLLGVPRSQKEIISKHYPGGVSEYIAASLRYIFTELSIQDNYFWYVYLKGKYSETCMPEYLRKDNFDTLCNRQAQIKQHNQTIADFLIENPGDYTHFVLLDHQDWLAAYDRPALESEWKLILANSTSGAKYLMRSAHIEPDFIPQFVLDECHVETELVNKYKGLDRVGTYATTLLFTRK